MLSGSDHQFAGAAVRDITATSTCTTTAQGDFHRWCQQMGMLPQAAPGWMSICRQPKACCLLYLTSVIMYLVSFGALYVGSLPSPGWTRTAAQLLLSVLGLASMAGMYRQGPEFAKSRLSKCILVGTMSSLVWNAVLSQTGAEDELPFGSSSVHILVGCLGVFFLTLGSLSGGVAAAHPAQPYTSIRTPAAEAATFALRQGNYLTDFGLVRVLLVHVRLPCRIVAILDCGCGALPPRPQLTLRVSPCGHPQRCTVILLIVTDSADGAG